MEHAAKLDGRIVESVFLSIHTDVIRIEGVLFTVGVSNKAGVETHSIETAMDMIDYDMLYGGWKDWSVPAVQKRLQEVEKYEILVPDHIPIRMILDPNG